MPNIAEECEHVWRVFTRLSSCSYAEIQAYSNIIGEEFAAWEVDALVFLDRIRNNPPTRLRYD